MNDERRRLTSIQSRSFIHQFQELKGYGRFCVPAHLEFRYAEEPFRRPQWQDCSIMNALAPRA